MVFSSFSGIKRMMLVEMMAYDILQYRMRNQIRNIQF